MLFLYRLIGIGFSQRNSSLDERPGLASNSWGYHGEDGRLFYSGSSVDLTESMPYQEGDVIGCCVDLARRTARFARNGIPLGKSPKPLASLIGLLTRILWNRRQVR